MGMRKSLRFFQFRRKNSSSINLGVASEDGSRFIDLNVQCMFPNSFIDVLKRNFDAGEFLHKVSGMNAENMSDGIELLPPVINPSKVISLNCDNKRSKDKATSAIISNKLPASLAGPLSPVWLPRQSNAIKFRTESGVVIGRNAHHVIAKDAMDYVFGYTSALNITSCGLNAKDGANQRFWGDQRSTDESSDSSCPIGPTIVHKSLITDPHDLVIATKKNGEIVSRENTSGLTCRIEQMIECITSFAALNPGDLILTGPPNAARCEGEYASVGDIVESEIENIGNLKNEILRHFKFNVE